MSKIYKCKLCQLTFTSKLFRAKHKQIHTLEKPFSCDVCDKNFARKSALNMHKKYMHGNEKGFSCDICGQTFKRPNTLKEHKNQHTGEKPFSCDICDKKYANSSSFSQHRLQHSDEKPYICDVCRKTFVNRSQLERHQLVHINPHSCDFCGEEFSYRTDLCKHIEVHLNEKTVKRHFPCDACVNHRQITAGEKPYDCTCHKSSGNNISVNHSLTEEKLFSCDVCDQIFTQANLLQNHQLQFHVNDLLSIQDGNIKIERDLHTELLIKDENVDSNDIIRDSITYDEEQIFSCDECQLAFADEDYLLVHKQIHARENPFSCGYCREKFAHAAELSKHNHLKHKS